MIPSFRFKFALKTLVVLAWFALPHGMFVNSQILPDAPIEGVRVTMFSEEGYRVWFLKGSSAAYLEDGAVELKDMDLEVYQGTEAAELDMHIVANEAVYRAEMRTISGDGGVFVDGDFYQIEGDSWQYSQDDRVVRVSSNVKVVIDYELEAFLK